MSESKTNLDGGKVSNVVAELQQTPWLTGVSTELARVGGVVISVIGNPGKRITPRSLETDILVGRMKTIVIQLTKWLDKEWEWTMSHDDSKVFTEYLRLEGNDIDSMIQVIAWNGKVFFDEKLLQYIVHLISLDVLSDKTGLRIYRSGKTVDREIKECIEKLWYGLWEIHFIAKTAYLKPDERQVLMGYINEVINAHRKIYEEMNHSSLQTKEAIPKFGNLLHILYTFIEGLPENKTEHKQKLTHELSEVIKIYINLLDK